MTPAVTLSLTAQGLQVASTVIAQQMRLADAMIDQAFVAQRALMGEYPTLPVAKRVVAKKAAARPKSTPKPAQKVARPIRTETVTSPKVIAAPVKNQVAKPAPAKPAAIVEAKAASVAAPAKQPKKAAPAKVQAVATAPVTTAPKAKSAAKTKAPAKAKAAAPRVDAAPNPAKSAPAPTVKKPASKAKVKKPAKKVTVADAPWNGKSAPKT